MESRNVPATLPRPWRLVVFTLTCAVGVLGLRIVLPPLSGVLARVTGYPFATYAYVWTLTGGLLIGHAWTLRVVEPRGWSYVGLGRDALRPSAIAIGLLLGMLGIGLPSVALLALHWLRIEPAQSGNSLTSGLQTLAILAPAALGEELMLRGYFFAVLREAWGVGRALLVTSILFGLLHLENAGATAQSVALVALAGIFLGAVLVTTGSLYAAWAAHLSWNFVQAAVLHSAVSGIGLTAPNYRVVDAGPDWATGGAWGPEGGLFAGLGMAVALLFLYRRRERRAE
jgi:membrane protease YdiL (CAAX protease family)